MSCNPLLLFLLLISISRYNLLTVRLPSLVTFPIAPFTARLFSGIKLTSHKGPQQPAKLPAKGTESDLDDDGAADDGKSAAPGPVDPADVTPTYFRLSPKAIARIASQRAASGPRHALRVLVDTGGCSGFQYRYSPAQLPDCVSLPSDSTAGAASAVDAATAGASGPLVIAGPGEGPRVFQVEEDFIFSHDGSAVVVDDVSLPFLKSAMLDYTVELIRSGFVVIENPNVDLACGCGTSFSRKGAK